ncbi:replication initiator protein A [Ligilactobacillus ruminis]|uniref:replication initiator protein A n=1 Tax=Ligilactobacillus ruminis TaxID=1623 RepID=UPI003081BB2A
MTNTIYIHQPEKAFSFTRLPNFLFEAPTFKPLSNEAKVLYAFILRRTELSRKNGWADDCGRIYLYYPICEVVDLLHCGRQKAVNTLRELQYAGLVEIQKQDLQLLNAQKIGEQEVEIFYRFIGKIE